MVRRPPESTLYYTLFPYATAFRSRIPSRDRASRLRLRGQRRRRSRRCRSPSWRSRRKSGFRSACPYSFVGDVPMLSLAPSPYLGAGGGGDKRSEEHTSELQSLMRISYAVFCLTKTT